MIIQRRPSTHSVRIITQHDHGLVSGEVAHAWLPKTHPRVMALVLTCAMHDIAWEPYDRIDRLSADRISFSPDRGAPHDFLTLGTQQKLELYTAGIDQLEAMHPWAGLLLSWHYAAFIPREKSPTFVDAERARRARLADQLGLDAPDAREVLDDFARLKFFDLISLYICLTAPGADHSALPFWITPEMECLGERFVFDWLDASTLSVDPWPVGRDLTVEIPYRELATADLSTPERLKRAHAAAPALLWRVTLCGTRSSTS